MTSAKTPAKPRTKKAKKDVEAERKALLDSIQGKYAWVPYSSEDFNSEKKYEIELEDRA